MPGGRLAPLTRAFRAQRQQQQRALAKAPQVTIVNREPEGAAAERSKQIAQLRALFQQGAGNVVKANIPSAAGSEQPDRHQVAAADVIAGVRAAGASNNAQTIRGRAAALARNRAASKTVPLKQYITPSGMVLDDEDIAGTAPAKPPAAAHASVTGAADIAKDLRGEAP